VGGLETEFFSLLFPALAVRSARGEREKKKEKKEKTKRKERSTEQCTRYSAAFSPLETTLVIGVAFRVVFSNCGI